MRCGLTARPRKLQRAAPWLAVLLHGACVFACQSHHFRVWRAGNKHRRRPGSCGGSPLSLRARNARQRWATAPYLPFPDLAAGHLCSGRRHGRASNGNGRACEWKEGGAAIARPGPPFGRVPRHERLTVGAEVDCTPGQRDGKTSQRATRGKNRRRPGHPCRSYLVLFFAYKISFVKEKSLLIVAPWKVSAY